MKTNPYRRHTTVAAIAATLVTTVLVATLVESFEPAKLFRLESQANSEATVAALRRPGDVPAGWT